MKKGVVVLPGEGEFDRRRVASFDVDAQKGFTSLCPEELPVPGGTEIVDELNADAKIASYRVGSKDAHAANALWVATEENPQFSKIIGANMNIRWNKHCVVGTMGFELLDGLPDVTGYDYMAYKGIELNMHPYGGCYHDFAEKFSTGVIEYLNCKKFDENFIEIKHEVELVIVGGLATEFCVIKTVKQLREAGFIVVLNLGACRGISEEGVARAISEMENMGVIIVKSAKEIQVLEP